MRHFGNCVDTWLKIHEAEIQTAKGNICTLDAAARPAETGRLQLEAAVKTLQEQLSTHTVTARTEGLAARITATDGKIMEMDKQLAISSMTPSETGSGSSTDLPYERRTHFVMGNLG